MTALLLTPLLSTLLLATPTATLQGTITGPDGKPAADVELMFEGEGLPRWEQAPRSDREGHYLVAGMPRAQVTVMVLLTRQWKPSPLFWKGGGVADLSRGDGRLDVMLIESAQGELMVTPAGKVASDVPRDLAIGGRVVDGKGAPGVGCRLALLAESTLPDWPQVLLPEGSLGGLAGLTTADGEGHFAFEKLPPARYQVNAECPGTGLSGRTPPFDLTQSRPTLQVKVLPPGARTDAPAKPVRRLTGQVVGPDGKAPRGVRLVGALQGSTVEAKTGRFSLVLSDVPGDDVGRVEADGLGGFGPTAEQTDGPAPDVGTVKLQPIVEFQLRVLAQGRLEAGTSALSASGSAGVVRNLGGERWAVRFDERPEARTVRLAVHVPGLARRCLEAKLPATPGVVDLGKVALEPGRAVKLKPVAADGAPLSWASSSVEVEGCGVLARASESDIEVDDLPRGPVKLRLLVSPFLPAEVVVPRNQAELTVTLAPLPKVEGRVTAGLPDLPVITALLGGDGSPIALRPDGRFSVAHGGGGPLVLRFGGPLPGLPASFNRWIDPTRTPTPAFVLVPFALTLPLRFVGVEPGQVRRVVVAHGDVPRSQGDAWLLNQAPRFPDPMARIQSPVELLEGSARTGWTLASPLAGPITVVVALADGRAVRRDVVLTEGMTALELDLR